MSEKKAVKTTHLTKKGLENIEKELLNRMVKFELAKVNTTGTIPS